MLPLIQSAYFQTLINGFPDGVIIFNIDGDAYVVNATALSLLGVEEETILRSRWDGLFETLPNRDEFIAYMETATQRNPTDASQRTAIHAEWTHPDGRHLHLSCTTSLIIEYEKIFGILLAITDVTHIFEMHARERKMLEEKRRVERERARGLQHFSMAVAHQIRNPVMTIAGFSRMLLRKCEEGSSQFELLTAILEGGMRLDDIVKVVSDYNALHVEKLVPITLGDSIHAARERALKCLRTTEQCEIAPPSDETSSAPEYMPLAIRNVSWIMDVAPCTIKGDAELLEMALAEVLRNSLEAVQLALEEQGDQAAAPSIKVQCRQVENRCEMHISDSGPGFDKEHLPYFFDPFFTTKSVGVGMGLCKAQRIIREHNGEITLENLPKGGALVRISLPMHAGPIDSGEELPDGD